MPELWDELLQWMWADGRSWFPKFRKCTGTVIADVCGNLNYWTYWITWKCFASKSTFKKRSQNITQNESDCVTFSPLQWKVKLICHCLSSVIPRHYLLPPHPWASSSPPLASSLCTSQPCFCLQTAPPHPVILLTPSGKLSIFNSPNNILGEDIREASLDGLDMCRKETSDNIRKRMWSMEQQEQRKFMVWDIAAK